MGNGSITTSMFSAGGGTHVYSATRYAVILMAVMRAEGEGLFLASLYYLYILFHAYLVMGVGVGCEEGL